MAAVEIAGEDSAGGVTTSSSHVPHRQPTGQILNHTFISLDIEKCVKIDQNIIL